jgi:YidC/Oxa1 family membrane protein insertase
MSQTMQKSQRILMLVLPIVFIPFVLNFPAGLMIYWLTTNLWTTGQGFITRAKMPRLDPEALKKSSRTLPKEAPADANGGNATGGKPKQPPASTAAAAGPPRRVKRKRSGGGGRRR